MWLPTPSSLSWAPGPYLAQGDPHEEPRTEERPWKAAHCHSQAHLSRTQTRFAGIWPETTTTPI